MKLSEILAQIEAPKGLSSVLAGISQSDYTVLPHMDGLTAKLSIAEEKVAQYEKQINECQSDWYYWSILGDLSYWRAVLNILRGADLVGENNMPNMPYEKKGMVVMDVIGNLEDYGKSVYRACMDQKNNP